MDTPNSGFGLIRKFPLDILAGIVLFVPGEDVGRLKMTGCKSLWSLLTCQNVVKSVTLGGDGIHFKKWPSFMNELPSLESLRISRNGKWWSELSLTLKQLPSTLRTLSLYVQPDDSESDSCSWSCDRLFEAQPKSDSFYPLDEHLPLLEVLKISDQNVTNFDWVSHCPPTLTSLSISNWKHGVELPSSLVHFESYAEELPTVFPLSLESLTCELYLQPLPALTSLSASLGDDPLVEPEMISSLPRSLTALHVTNTIPLDTWPFLPSNLQSLSFDATNEDHTVISRMIDPVTGEVHQIPTFPLELLPKSLTKLRILGGLNCDFFVSGNCSSLFPPHLKSFDAAYLRLAPNAAKQLPSSLTDLSTSHFYEQLCEHLPEGLTSLSFRKALLSPKTIRCLPKSLTNLEGHFSYWNSDPSEWFDYTTGKKSPISSFPEYSFHEDYASFFACLPSSLTCVQLHRFKQLQDDFIKNQNFPNLLSLTFFGTTQLSDVCIPLLNRHLRHLEVHDCRKITGKCFKYLPRSLTSLSLGSTSVFDEDIKDLPRTLEEFEVPSATELSDACIRDFPRSCTDLSIWENSKITQLCIPDFPNSLATFFGAEWRWRYGNVSLVE